MSISNSINRRINIIMPYGEVIIIMAQYVQETKDGKYVLSYLEKRNGTVSPNFTEIVYIDGQWAKSPFHLSYESYDFKEFDRSLSEKIINELPDNMKIRIVINDDRKKIDKIEENNNKVELNYLGATEITEKIEEDVYCVLIANSSSDYIKKDEFYPYDFSFPIFSIEGKDNHMNVNYEGDINSGLDFNELELARFGLSQNSRRKIKDFLMNYEGVIKISELPILEIDNKDELIKVHFVNCPEITTFNNIYKTVSLFIDYDIGEDLTVKELIKKALNNEIPFYYETESGTKNNNGVKHNSIVK